MAWFKNLKVKAKMIVSFMVVIALMATLAAVSVIQIKSVTNTYEAVVDHVEVGRNAITLFQSNFRDLRRIIATLSTYTGYDLERSKELINDATASYNTSLGFLDMYEEAVRTNPLLSAADIKLRIDNAEEVRRIAARYLSNFMEPMFDAARKDDHNLSLEVIALGAPIATEIRDAVQAILDVSNEAVDVNTANAEAASVTTVYLLIGIAVVAAILAILIALYVANLIGKPIGTISGFLKQAGATGDISLRPEDVKNIEVLSKIKDEIGDLSSGAAAFVQHVSHISEELNLVADGDLTTELEILSDRDVMGKALVHMVNSLNTLFGEINQSTAQVSSGSKQIADGAQSLAQGSTEQASSIEQLSASITEIAVKTKDNAEKAGKAAVLANTIKQNAEKGSRQMDEMTTAVKDINTASQNIKKVIKVIDDIAFQTNILALNAAVEAARAGQHGKGFAVVAEEVRNLASKSADAARETGEMIENSMEKAELGTRIADETAASLAEIVSGINESSQIVSEIAQASDEQTAGITQINAGIDQVANVVQQNSATAEESAAASEEMSGQSSMLEELVAQFKLKDGGQSARAKRLPATSGRQIAMPERTPQNGGGDFGKY
ncbi:MAG: methyl-accepting chemotaxis protein [Oscillospiraceae bacterium]|nr:methyl-accepting chemotaxis protein [Oscillospiraceae bacterium]